MRRSNFSRQLSTVPLQQRSLSLRPANVYSLSVSSALFQSPAKRRRNSSSSVVCRLPQQVPHPTLIDRQIDGQIFSIGSAFSFAPRPLSLIASSNCRFSLMFCRHLYHRSWGILGGLGDSRHFIRLPCVGHTETSRSSSALNISDVVSVFRSTASLEV